MSVLQTFQGDVATREALLAFMTECINEEALKRMYAGEDVSHIKDAVELLEVTFNKLEEIYGIKTNNGTEQTNHAK